MSDTAVATEVETANELIVVKALVPAVVFAPGGVEALVDKLERDVRAEITKLDISTPKGRDEIRSLAFKVARSKTAIDDMGKNLVAEWKEKANLVDADRRLLRERLDNLKIEARKPLTEWEDAEKTRVLAHENAMTFLQDFAAFPTPEPDSATVRARLQALADMPPRDWQEFSKRANDATAAARTRLDALLAAAVRPRNGSLRKTMTKVLPTAQLPHRSITRWVSITLIMTGSSSRTPNRRFPMADKVIDTTFSVQETRTFPVRVRIPEHLTVVRHPWGAIEIKDPAPPNPDQPQIEFWYSLQVAASRGLIEVERTDA